MRDYANGSVQTTWLVSYDRIRQLDPAAAKLLQLWAYLDHQDLWFELLTRGSSGLKDPDWLQDIVRQELRFKGVMKRLLAYSLVESHQDIESYSMHPVVHDWCIESISCGKLDLMRLALIIVGAAAPKPLEPANWAMQQRLLPHANRCMQQLHTTKGLDEIEDGDCNDGVYNLGFLYFKQGKLAEAEKMYQRALKGHDEVWGSEHESTLNVVYNIGVLYFKQDKWIEAEKMFRRALNACDKERSPKHKSTIKLVTWLSNVYAKQGKRYKDENKLIEANKMYQRLLKECQEYEFDWFDWNHIYIHT